MIKLGCFVPVIGDAGFLSCQECCVLCLLRGSPGESPPAPRDNDTRGRGLVLLAGTRSRSGVQGRFLDRAGSQRVGAGVWGSAFLLLGGEPGSGALR